MDVLAKPPVLRLGLHHDPHLSQSEVQTRRLW